MTRAQAAQLKKDFLDVFRLHGNISAACRAIGIGRRTVYDWQEQDDIFALGFREAEIESTERLEAEAYRRAHDGVVKTKGVYYLGARIADEEVIDYSDTLLIFLLKARNREKYGDHARITNDTAVSLEQAREVLGIGSSTD